MTLRWLRAHWCRASASTAALLALAALLVAGPADGAFPGANGRITFSATNGGDLSTQIYTVSASGGRPAWITDVGWGSAYSADGRWIAFSGYAPGGDGIAVISANADQEGPGRWNPHLIIPGRAAGEPAWSPDGRALVYSICRASGKCAVYTARRDGKARRRVASGSHPAWSVNGLLAFERRSSDGYVHIFSMTRSGRGLRALTSGRAHDSGPDWAPDGSGVVFSRNGDLYRVSRFGGPLLQLTGRTRGERDGDFDPAFSPDGDKIVFARNAVITIVDASGANARAVKWGCTPDEGCGAGAPDWQPAESRNAASR